MQLTLNQVIIIAAPDTFESIKLKRNQGLIQPSGPGRFVALIDNAQWGIDNGTGEPGGDAPLAALNGVTLGPTDHFYADVLFGDLNLDGVVDGNDLSLCDVGLGSGEHSSGWNFGDITNLGRTSPLMDQLLQIAVAAGA